MNQGRVNKNFKITVGDGETLRVKQYFTSLDRRDKCGNEYDFSQYAWDSGVRCIPEPLGIDPVAKLGLYSFIPGASMDGDICVDDLSQALSFITHLNDGKALYNTSRSRAFHAVNSIGEYITEVERRYAMFNQIDRDSAIDNDAAVFASKLVCKKDGVIRELSCSVNEPWSTVAENDKCVSPGDFGFHNAITHEGVICFLDFEYARYDDPACMVCDFLLQPRYDIPSSLYDIFVDGVMGIVSDRKAYMHRLEVYWKLAILKWCRIMMSIFLPIGKQKFVFSGEERGLDEEQERRLAEAKELIGIIDIPLS